MAEKRASISSSTMAMRPLSANACDARSATRRAARQIAGEGERQL